MPPAIAHSQSHNRLSQTSQSTISISKPPVKVTTITNDEQFRLQMTKMTISSNRLLPLASCSPRCNSRLVHVVTTLSDSDGRFHQPTKAPFKATSLADIHLFLKPSAPSVSKVLAALFLKIVFCFLMRPGYSMELSQLVEPIPWYRPDTFLLVFSHDVSSQRVIGAYTDYIRTKT